jgi:hypothetical protein
MYADCGIKIGVGRARTPAVPRGGLASRGLLRVARGSSLRRLVEARSGLTEPFDAPENEPHRTMKQASVSSTVQGGGKRRRDDTERTAGAGTWAVVFGAPCGINATHPGIMRVDDRCPDCPWAMSRG